MTFDRVRASLQDRCAQCPISEGDKLCGECPDAYLRALLKVAEAAKEVDDALSGEGGMWRLEPEELDALDGLYAALAEVEGME